MKLKDSMYTYDQFEILQEEKWFYVSLYTSKNLDTDKFSQSPFPNPNDVTLLSQEDKLTGEYLIFTNECLNAPKKFWNNKTSGNVGFTSVF